MDAQRIRTKWDDHLSYRSIDRSLRNDDNDLRKGLIASLHRIRIKEGEILKLV